MNNFGLFSFWESGASHRFIISEWILTDNIEQLNVVIHFQIIFESHKCFISCALSQSTRSILFNSGLPTPLTITPTPVYSFISCSAGRHSQGQSYCYHKDFGYHYITNCCMFIKIIEWFLFYENVFHFEPWTRNIETEENSILRTVNTSPWRKYC